MVKAIKIILGILGAIILGLTILVVTFIFSMKPDPDKEMMIKTEAEQYISENFNEHFEVYDTLFDNMGNFEFEYAAKARDRQNGIEFYVFHDSESETGELVDTYIANKWEDELLGQLRPYINQHFKDASDCYVYIEDKIGKRLQIDSHNSESYKEYDINPIIRMTFPRKKSDIDDENFNAFITYLQNKDIVKHGTLIVAYIAENGEILEPEEWSKEF
ncbi:hypothetical protein [Bacillus sp. Marseille-P3661]|uniref:hypothetical protein n=1 Tax=Bacillus sp. Marseille-P3661 TaxID=1936234 RepID=UPI000C82095A|nr:hypothetical protein [Bacillus sp. Marseille-P3661]